MGSTTGTTDTGSSGSGTTANDAATLFDSWEVEAAIERFDYKQQRFSENGLTLTTAAKTVVSTLNSKKSGYQDMITNYSKYTKSQINSAVSEIDDMTAQLKVNVELVYYPEHSKAIFDAINEYRNSLGLSSLTWSDNLSTTARYECGYYCYTYPDGNDLNEHATAQLSVCAYIGTFSASQALEAWKNSSMHDPTLRSTSATHGAVAYYSCNDEDGGIWSKAIFAHGISTTVGATHCPDSYKSLVLNCKTSSAT